MLIFVNLKVLPNNTYESMIFNYFANINFREFVLYKYFANTNFRELVTFKYFAKTYFREFVQNSRKLILLRYSFCIKWGGGMEIKWRGWNFLENS